MDKRALAREKLLFRYSAALERGDFDTVARVLREAEDDSALEGMILEINATYSADATGDSSRFSRTRTLRPSHQVNHKESQDDMIASSTYRHERGLGIMRSPVRGSANALSLAAVIVLVVFAALILSRLPMDSASPYQGASSNGSPEGGSASGGNLQLPSQAAANPVNCLIMTNAEGGTPVYTLPSLDSQVVDVIESGITLRVLDTVNTDPSQPAQWVYAVPTSTLTHAQGWVNLAYVQLVGGDCPSAIAMPEAAPVIVTATPTLIQPDMFMTPLLSTATPIPAAFPADAAPVLEPIVEEPTAVPMIPDKATPTPFPLVLTPDWSLTPPDGISQFAPAACIVILNTNRDVYDQPDAKTPMLALPGGTWISILNWTPGSDRLQIAATIGDISVIGAWMNGIGINIPDGCMIEQGAVDVPQPALAQPMDGTLIPTVLPPTVPPR